MSEALKELPPTIWWRCGEGMREGETRGSSRSMTSWEHWKRSMGGIVKLNWAEEREGRRVRKVRKERMMCIWTRNNWKQLFEMLKAMFVVKFSGRCNVV